MDNKLTNHYYVTVGHLHCSTDYSTLAAPCLNVKDRVKFKSLCNNVYKNKNNIAPFYLNNFIILYLLKITTNERHVVPLI